MGDEEDPYAEFAADDDPYSGFEAEEDPDARYGGTAELPAHYGVRAGRTTRELELPETTFEVGGGAVPETAANQARFAAMTPEGGTVIERRQIAKLPSTSAAGYREEAIPGVGTRVSADPGADVETGIADRRTATQRLRDVMNVQSGRLTGHDVPSLASLGRAQQLAEEHPTTATIPDLINTAWPTAAIEPEFQGQPDRRQMAIPRAVANAVWMGHGDEGRATIQSAMEGIGRDPDELQRPLVPYGERLENARTELEQSAAQAPEGTTLGTVAGTAPLMLIPGAGATAPARMLIGGGAGTGAGLIRGAGESEASLSGAGRALSGMSRLLTGPENETEARFARSDVQQGAGEINELSGDALEEGLIEGGLAAGTMGLSEGAVPALRALQGAFGRRGQTMARAGTRSRMEGSGAWGRAASRTAERLPGGETALAADAQRLGIGHGVSRGFEAGQGGTGRRALFPRSERVLEDAAEVMASAGDRMADVTRRMDAAGPGLTEVESVLGSASVDMSRVADEMAAIAREYDALPVGGEQVASALRTRLVEPLRAAGPMTFSEAHRQRRVIDDMIRSWSGDVNLSTAAGRLRTARRSIANAMEEAAENVDPALREAWLQANRDYSVGRFFQERGRGATGLSVQGGQQGAMGAAMVNAASHIPGAGIPAGMLQREVAQQSRMMQPGIRTALAEAGSEASGLVERGIERLLASGDPTQGGWGRMLQAAQQRGGAAVAAVHAMLIRTRPGYRAVVEDLESADSGEEEEDDGSSGPE